MKGGIVCAAALALFPLLAAAEGKTYYRKDYQYFKPAFADVRRPDNYMRLYAHRPVAFTRNPDRNHRFWDVGFGGNFAWWGYNVDDPGKVDKMAVRGMAAFWEPAAHALLDFGAQSNALINADYRLGLGVAGRGIPWAWRGPRLSWRFSVFHESSHLGDEFVLDALKRDGLLAGEVVEVSVVKAPGARRFQRYNVGYEAAELYMAIDDYARDYRRLYAGGRYLDHAVYEAEPLKYRDEGLNAPLRSRHWEGQAGGEYFARLEAQGGWGNPNTWIGRLNGLVRHVRFLDYLFPRIEEAHYGVVADEVYLRSQYAAQRPEWKLGTNLVAGLVWGEYFAADEGVSSFALLVDYYHGLNPHGQFRDEEWSYWGLEFKVRL